MDECYRNVAFIHNRVLFNYIKNKIRLFARKWVELETLMLNEIGESHNGNFCVFSHVWKLGGGEEVKVKGHIRDSEGESQRGSVSYKQLYAYVEIPRWTFSLYYHCVLINSGCFK